MLFKYELEFQEIRNFIPVIPVKLRTLRLSLRQDVTNCNTKVRVVNFETLKTTLYQTLI